MCSYDTERKIKQVFWGTSRDGGRKIILFKYNNVEITHLHEGEACCERTGWR